MFDQSLMDNKKNKKNEKKKNSTKLIQFEEKNIQLSNRLNVSLPVDSKDKGILQ